MPLAPCSIAAAETLPEMCSLDAYANNRREMESADDEIDGQQRASWSAGFTHTPTGRTERGCDSPSRTIWERSSASSSSSLLALLKCARARSNGDIVGNLSLTGAGKHIAEGVLSALPDGGIIGGTGAAMMGMMTTRGRDGGRGESVV